MRSEDTARRIRDVLLPTVAQGIDNTMTAPRVIGPRRRAIEPGNGSWHTVNTMYTNRVVVSADAEFTVAEQVYYDLRAALVHGEFPPGSRLTERQLGERYDASRTPVREATRRLQSEGLLRRVGRGVLVTTLSLEEAEQAYRTRVVLEQLAATSAAEQVKLGQVAPSRVADLRNRVEAVREAARHGDARRASLENLDLHKELAQLGANPFIVAALEPLWDRIAVSSLSNLTDEVWNETVYNQHNAIVDLVASGRSHDAGIHMVKHIEDAIHVYIQHERQNTND